MKTKERTSPKCMAEHEGKCGNGHQASHTSDYSSHQQIVREINIEEEMMAANGCSLDTR